MPRWCLPTKNYKFMAARKSKPVKKATLAKKKKGPQLEDYFKIGESYTSLVMGIVVVIIASILLVSFFRTRTQPHLQKATSSISTVAQQENPSPTPSPTLVPLSVTPPPTQAPINSKEKTYTVKAGDSLWSIAVAEYNDGYKWTEIAKANNLSNPGIINVDNHLVIPAVASSSQPAPASTKMGSASPSTGAA
ncbi:MAG TPA: LysM peptidoglycan-binding domain-containing protein, partial [Patescibacteria group bacterium]|nr:LysM peptidoglycan-binding domain-containing protein [Patescibacteria group bacterium]